MKISIVMGISGSGKSTYIKEYLSDRKVVDLYSFQEPYINKGYLGIEEIKQSYIDAKNTLIEYIKQGEDVVLEHTLLKAIRRVPYIEAIKEITDEPIEIILINPSLEILRERWKKREMYWNDDEILSNLAVLEIPTLEEGFSKVTIITK